MNRMLATTMLALSLTAASAATPALAQSDQQDQTEAEQRIQQGLSAILEGLALFMQDIPRYDVPEILPNGDIIIRRINPNDAPGWKEEEDQTAPKPGDGKTI
ncbi:MAG: hypothetical protein NXI19_03030 [Alphaproteobacteria bacterium]|nr:hypothetical protein [Alphaproteobacteria bacterium]